MGTPLKPKYIPYSYMDSVGGRLYLLGAPYATTLAPVLRASGLHPRLASGRQLPRPSSYPLLGPEYLLLGTIYPQLRVQGGSWYIPAAGITNQRSSLGDPFYSVGAEPPVFTGMLSRYALRLLGTPYHTVSTLPSHAHQSPSSHFPTSQT